MVSSSANEIAETLPTIPGKVTCVQELAVYGESLTLTRSVPAATRELAGLFARGG